MLYMGGDKYMAYNHGDDCDVCAIIVEIIVINQMKALYLTSVISQLTNLVIYCG